MRKEGRVEEADAIQIEKPVLNLQHALTIWSRPVSRLSNPYICGQLTSLHSSKCSFGSLSYYFSVFSVVSVML